MNARSKTARSSEVDAMTIEARQVTAEELLRMPDDGSRYELVEGELRKMVPAGNRHLEPTGKVTA